LLGNARLVTKNMTARRWDFAKKPWLIEKSPENSWAAESRKNRRAKWDLHLCSSHNTAVVTVMDTIKM
jgi:hypothetical protein